MVVQSFKSVWFVLKNSARYVTSGERDILSRYIWKPGTPGTTVKGISEQSPGSPAISSYL
eukprot:1334113-Amorphochlora_amoeboformis.AAC.1